jgi:catechol 2,3-dioxygenase-like lactoylglutathione lyase family enzyme
MGIKRLNHAVLYVSDVAQSSAFYQDTLGFRFKPSNTPDKAAFSQAAESDNDHDLALFSKNLGQQRAGVFRAHHEVADPSEPPAGLYHLAWEVDTLDELIRIRSLLQAQGRLGLEEDHGVHKSIYGHDPDGLLFEIAWFVPPHLLTAEDKSQSSGTLDLEKERLRFAAIA